MQAPSPPSQARCRAQITRFGMALDGHLGNQVAEHNGGSGV
jgi:hypothetical protein